MVPPERIFIDVTKRRYGVLHAPQRAFSPCADVHGELCGQERTRFFGDLSAANPFAPHHAVNMDSTNDNESFRPGSRMARALRVREERVGSSGAEARADNGISYNDGVEAGVPPDNPPVVCEHCGREFRNMRGLGVHVVRAHPVEANNAVNTDRVKARWAVEEVRLMARAEAAAISAGGIIFMNQLLKDKFPHRSLEAIKGKRRHEDYRAMVRGFCQEIQSNTVAIEENVGPVAAMIGAAGDPRATETAINDISAHQPIPQQRSERLRDTIASAVVRSSEAFRGFEADTLVEIAREALRSGVVDLQAIERWLGRIFPSPQVHPPRRGLVKQRGLPNKRENREQKRKREFAITQTLYKKNLKTCLSHILEGCSERRRPSAVEFRDYWRPVMETSSAADGDMTALREQYGEARQVASASRSLPPRARGIHLEGLGEGAAADSGHAVDRTLLWDPITTTEVTRISVKTGTAPGLDGVTPRVWNAVPSPIRALLFNLLLLARAIPSSIATTRTVFLEKGGMSDVPEPSEYRPLSIGSVIVRHLHKILAKRLTALDIMDRRQRGFRPVDGVCENITVLSAVLGDARRQKRSLHVATVDISKAFDTVAHKAIHKTLDELDLPWEFREYIRAVYNNAQTSLQASSNGEVSTIKIGRGVRQGDPLSPLLFNLVVDRALGFLSEDVGYRMGDSLVNALGYADDIVLLSSTKMGLQENLTRLHAAFQRSGLSVNAKKTGVLSMVASGRDKKVKIDVTPYFTLGGALIPQRSPVEAWTYLGCMYKGAREEANVPPLAQAIEQLTKAPLKPQQRLRLLRDCLLPRYYHRWVIGAVTSKTLRGVDMLVRAAVRRWLRLPHDVPAGYFHAPIQSGGLGMPLLKVWIPILKHNRLLRLCRSTLPAACAAAESTYVARQLVWCENQMRVRGHRVTTTVELGQQCAAWLRESCDGNGLREAATSKLSSHWISAGADAIPGADYVHYHHIRANCIPSRARVSRGRDGRNVRCRAGCPEIETSAHCVQRCFRTHGGRILRHNDLCRRVGGFLQQKGWQVDAELAYATSAGRRRPDLTIAKGGEAVVVDAQVVSSETALGVSHERKVAKYRSCEDLADRVAEYTGVPRNNVRFTALTISWRGVWSSQSEREMRSLGLTSSQLRNLTTRVLWGSWMNWRRYNSITTRYCADRLTAADRGAGP